MCTLLDARTKNASHLGQDEYDEACKMLKEEYVRYATNQDIRAYKIQNAGAAKAQIQTTSTEPPAISNTTTRVTTAATPPPTKKRKTSGASCLCSKLL